MTSYNEKSQDSLQGILVQEIPGVKAIQKMQGDTDVELASGAMRVLLVTLDVSNPFEDQSKSEKARAVESESVDIWVVLEIGSNFSFPIRANQTIVPDRGTSSYKFPSVDVPGAAISLVLSSDRQSSSIQQFEELLTDYCAFQSDSKGKGTIELMDEKGHLLGTIDGPWHLEEDAGMHKPGYEKDPVLVELPPDGSSSSGTDQKITVSTAPRTEEGVISPAYQNDWLLKGATLVSKTLVGGSTWAGQKMIGVADSYVAKTTPPMSRQPTIEGEKLVDEKDSSQLAGDASRPLTTSGKPAMTFNPKVHATSQQLKAFSGTATAVSGRTRDAVLTVAGKVGDKIGKTTGIQSQSRADGTVVKPSGIRGVLNRSLIAANVVLDGLTQSAETLLASGGEASSRAIEHRYGSEAKVISGNTASLGRSAFVVYKDINGVRRKALLKIATGTIKARAPDGSEVVLQQESLQATPAQASSSVAAPPAYGQDNKSDYRIDSDHNFPAQSLLTSPESSIDLPTRPACPLPFDYWHVYEAASLPNTPRHKRPSEYWYSPIESAERLSSSPCTEKTSIYGSTSGLLASSKRSSLIDSSAQEQSPYNHRVPLFPSTPSMVHQHAAPFVSVTPHCSTSASYRVSTSTPSFNSAFAMQTTIHYCGGTGGGRIQHPLRRLKLRTPSQLHSTVTPRRVMGVGKSPLDDNNGQQTAEAIDRVEWTATTSQGDATTDCDECEAGLVSPLLKASQESGSMAIDRLCCLTESDGTAESDISLQGGDHTLNLLRQMRQRDNHQDEDSMASCSNKKPRLELDNQAISRFGNDPFYTYPSASDLSPEKASLGEQVVDAASILLSIGQGNGFQTRPRRPESTRRYSIPESEESSVEETESDEEQEEDTYHPGEAETSLYHGQRKTSPYQQQPYLGDTRVFPQTIPIDMDEFPRLYQRYKVPSSITKSEQTAVYGAQDAAKIQDKELQKIASRGLREMGTWHEPTDALDLYTPRWVRGALKDKMGLCTICYEEDPSEIVWKRTKTSEYNYHLINQHGISPQTHRPYDPPIAFREREQTSSSAGHRKSIIQGKCHACKKYIDMQGKYAGQVKVPEIYWWKHARKCHKDKKGLAGTSGVFVEDNFYHRVVASMAEK